MKTCKDCRYYEGLENPEVEGICYRYPPGVNSVLLPGQSNPLSMVPNQPTLEIRNFGTRPPIRADERTCGEFKEKIPLPN